MKNFNRFFFRFGCVLLFSLTPILAHAEEVVVGVNLVNTPYDLTLQEQDSILDIMKDAGVRVIRSGIPDGDKGLDFVQRVYAHGIKIEWIAKIRGLAGNMTLNAADPSNFLAYYQPFLTKLESKKIVLAGIELGNEINSSGWFSNLSNRTGRVLTLEDLSRDPEGQEVAKGYVNYIKLLAVLKGIRDNSRLNQHTPIISAGLSPIEPPSTWSKNDGVSLTATIQFLRVNGADAFIDGYGVHWYPKGNVSPSARLTDMKHIFAQCGSTYSGGKPCWLTEWGLPVGPGKSCPAPADDGRAAIFSELRYDFSQVAKLGQLKGILFYTWEGKLHDSSYAYDPYSAFLCGSLSKSGRVAIAPM